MVNKLTNFENPRTPADYNKSVLYKKFFLAFINNYSTLLYMAFVKVSIRIIVHLCSYCTSFLKNFISLHPSPHNAGANIYFVTDTAQLSNYLRVDSKLSANYLKFCTKYSQAAPIIQLHCNLFLHKYCYFILRSVVSSYSTNHI